MNKITVAIPFTDGTYERYTEAITDAGMNPVCIHSPAEDHGCDALLLPGGADINPCRYNETVNGSKGIDDALDELQLSMLRIYSTAGKPVLGICRGHQLINVYFGGTLYQDLDTADSHKIIDGAEQFHTADFISGTILSKLYGPCLTVNSSHHQGIKTPGKDLDIIAKASDGTVEAVIHRTLPVLGVQWHPERMKGDVFPKADGLKLFMKFKEIIENHPD